MPIRVLVIDDDADFRSMIRLTLQSDLGIAVTGEAEDGEAGIAFALQQDFDVVLVDLMMPRVDGFQAIRWIKQGRPDVKVLLLTSFADEAIRRDADHSGADAFLDKRDIPTTLVSVVRSITHRTSPGAGPLRGCCG